MSDFKSTTTRLSKLDQDHVEIPFSDEQRDRCEQLAKFLWDIDDAAKFNMGSFARSARGRGLLPRQAAECGTVCCALGYGPAAGIATDSDRWDEYSKLFIPWTTELGSQLYPELSSVLLEETDAGAFVFGGCWELFNNTAQGAAQRLWYTLDYGVPKGTWGAFGTAPEEAPELTPCFKVIADTEDLPIISIMLRTWRQ